MIVYLNDNIHPEAVALLKSSAEVVSDFDRIREIDGMVVRATPVPRSIIEQAPRRRV